MVAGACFVAEAARGVALAKYSLDMKLLEVTSMTEMGGLPQLMNTINPGEFRVGKVGLEFPELCDVKLVNKDEVSRHSQ